MNMDNIKNGTKLLIKYTFNDTIDRVFHIITNVDLHRQYMVNYVDKMELTKGTSLAELDAEVSFTWCKTLNLEMKVIAVTNTDSYKRIKLRLLNMTGYMDFDVIHSLYNDSISGATLYVKETVIRIPNKPPSKEEIEEYRKQHLDIFAKMKDCLKMTTVNLEQTESIIVDVSRELLWKCITDWRVFAKLVPGLANEVVYRGDPRSVGSLMFIKTDSLQCNLRVIKSEKLEFVLESFASQPVSPLQELIFNFYEIDENKTYLCFKHKFKEAIEFKYFKNLVENKKQILLNLKKQVEKNIS
jgi:hypothetical protein